MSIPAAMTVAKIEDQQMYVPMFPCNLACSPDTVEFILINICLVSLRLFRHDPRNLCCSLACVACIFSSHSRIPTYLYYIKTIFHRIFGQPTYCNSVEKSKPRSDRTVTTDTGSQHTELFASISPDNKA